MKKTELPLFPLRTVLVPGGRLPLQIFEPRYLELVRDCARDGAGFGVCLILEGSEAGAPPQHTSIGTLATIRDFDTLPNGLLGIVVEGGERFRVLSTRVRHNGLLTGAVSWLPAAPPTRVADEHLVLVQILERLLEQVGDRYPDWRREQLEDAQWVGFRLTELLPLADLEKQSLLGLDDPGIRLQRLLERLPDFQRSS